MSEQQKQPPVRIHVGEAVPSGELERDRERRGAAGEDEIRHEAAERAVDAAIAGIDVPSRRDR